jgi:acetoacetyl-CoA synthetase
MTTHTAVWPESDADDVVWRPTPELRGSSGLSTYLAWLEQERALSFADYHALWRWSITELGEFWRSVWDFEDVQADGSPATVIATPKMPGAAWFPDVQLNYAEHLLRESLPAGPALLWLQEDADPQPLSWSELARAAGALAHTLLDAGVRRGDRVVAYLPNGPEAVIGLIACASLGAVWAICSPDLGVLGVRSRLEQLSPKVLIATDGYRFNGRAYARHDEVAYLTRELVSLERVIWVRRLQTHPPRLSCPIQEWSDATSGDSRLRFERVPFSHPLWVLFSSGTTGVPKGIVHGHGGILLEHLKTLRLHDDVRRGERFLYMASTSWMVWNLLVSGLLVGATVVLFDGSPNYPEPGALWGTARRERVRTLGVGAGYVHASMKTEMTSPGPFSELCHISVTGSPLSPAGFAWLRETVGPDVWLSSSSGGTDVCTGFVGGCPLVAVRTGRLQVPCLGVAVEAWDGHGHSIVAEQGELVITRPMPSMPLHLWNDSDGQRLRSAYFSMFPGIWRHGDFIEFAADGSSVIHGRSDATLNRQGIRLGSAEIYAAVEAVPGVVEALVVGVESGADAYYMPLFVVLSDGVDLEDVRQAIVTAIRASLSPRHVPDEIISAPGIPHTRTGKKLEVPVKRLLQGVPADEVVDVGSIDDPAAFGFYEGFARTRASTHVK